MKKGASFNQGALIHYEYIPTKLLLILKHKHVPYLLHYSRKP